jgi:hypothetical protein
MGQEPGIPGDMCGILGYMIDSPREVRVLSEVNSRRLLRSTQFGQIVYTHDALPAIAQVTFILDGNDIILRTAPGSELDAATKQGATVAFEIGPNPPLVGHGGRTGHPRDQPKDDRPS